MRKRRRQWNYSVLFPRRVPTRPSHGDGTSGCNSYTEKRKKQKSQRIQGSTHRDKEEIPHNLICHIHKFIIEFLFDAYMYIHVYIHYMYIIQLTSIL